MVLTDSQSLQGFEKLTMDDLMPQMQCLVPQILDLGKAVHKQGCKT